MNWSGDDVDFYEYDEHEGEELEFGFSRIVHETDKAVLVILEDTDEEVWFPLSVCDFELNNKCGIAPDLKMDTSGTIRVPRWLARKKELSD